MITDPVNVVISHGCELSPDLSWHLISSWLVINKNCFGQDILSSSTRRGGGLLQTGCFKSHVCAHLFFYV